MTTRELAAHLEVSERTICRDMEALSAAGIPVYADRGPLGGWTLSDGYRTRLTGMTQQELLSLLLARPSGALKDLGIGSDFESAFRKVLAASPESLREYAGKLQERIHIDGTAWHARLDPVPYLAAVQEAVWNCRKLAIQYSLPSHSGGADAAGQNEGGFEGVVCPLGLVAKRSIWYVVAQTGADTVFYRVSRLLEVRVLDETFERPAGFDLAGYWEQAAEQFAASRWTCRVRLRVKEEMLPHLPPERRARLVTSRTLPDGWIEAEIEFRTWGEARATAFALGPNAEVLEPAELRAELLEAAKAIVEMYGESSVHAPKL
jgi:predicted DNA-binding transcriptional regulator YafY